MTCIRGVLVCDHNEHRPFHWAGAGSSGRTHQVGGQVGGEQERGGEAGYQGCPLCPPTPVLVLCGWDLPFVSMAYSCAAQAAALHKHTHTPPPSRSLFNLSLPLRTTTLFPIIPSLSVLSPSRSPHLQQRVAPTPPHPTPSTPTPLPKSETPRPRQRGRAEPKASVRLTDGKSERERDRWRSQLYFWGWTSTIPIPCLHPSLPPLLSPPLPLNPNPLHSLLNAASSQSHLTVGGRAVNLQDDTFCLERRHFVAQLEKEPFKTSHLVPFTHEEELHNQHLY